MPDHQQSDPVRELFEKGFLSLYSQDVLQQKDFSKEQQVELTMHLTAPVVQAYFKELSHNIMLDLMRLDFTRSDDQLKLAQKQGVGKGALEVVYNIVKLTEK